MIVGGRNETKKKKKKKEKKKKKKKKKEEGWVGVGWVGMEELVWNFLHAGFPITPKPLKRLLS